MPLALTQRSRGFLLGWLENLAKCKISRKFFHQSIMVPSPQAWRAQPPGGSHCPSSHPSHQQKAPNKLKKSAASQNPNARHLKSSYSSASKTPIEVLLVDMSGDIQHLFFSHLVSVHLTQINHHVALLNATSKTHRYKLPLLHIIGQKATKKNFSIIFC
ncbi:uncharacterized protein VP01_3321g2 [Puccinia sorghi]|uniref:Uncharacterized protein n=1 Tax=Puccinia sorghi TaxID=27349 RepID=A0A0L6UXC7_9BASI|nr:uncharacterized protein VP01_3321g2 [Puccinia sorghi]